MSAAKLAAQRERRKANQNADTKKYEKTPKGFLMRLYRNMQSRIDGVQHLKEHLYAGKSLIDRDTFYNWATASPDFWKLFAEYTAHGYMRKLAPSVDRKDSADGYVLDNMEWVTMSENSRRGAMSRHQKVKK